MKRSSGESAWIRWVAPLAGNPANQACRTTRLEDGACWIALTSWACGWAAARETTGSPLVVAGAAAWMLLSVDSLRFISRTLHEEQRLPLRETGLHFIQLLPLGLSLAWFLRQLPHDSWGQALPLPAILYGGIVVAGLERLVTSRLLATVALTALAPATYLSATGSLGMSAFMLWLALGGYFLLDVLFVMARFRKSARLLWSVRVTAPAVALSALWCSSHRLPHGLLVGAFLILSVRAWAFRAGVRAVNARRMGRIELAYGTLAAALITLSLMRT